MKRDRGLQLWLGLNQVIRCHHVGYSESGTALANKNENDGSRMSPCEDCTWNDDCTPKLKLQSPGTVLANPPRLSFLFRIPLRICVLEVAVSAPAFSQNGTPAVSAFAAEAKFQNPRVSETQVQSPRVPKNPELFHQLQVTPLEEGVPGGAQKCVEGEPDY